MRRVLERVKKPLWLAPIPCRLCETDASEIDAILFEKPPTLQCCLEKDCR